MFIFKRFEIVGKSREPSSYTITWNFKEDGFKWIAEDILFRLPPQKAHICTAITIMVPVLITSKTITFTEEVCWTLDTINFCLQLLPIIFFPINF